MNKKVVWGIVIFSIVAIAIAGVVYFNFKKKTARDYLPASSSQVIRVNFSELQKIAPISEFSKLLDMYSISIGGGNKESLFNEILAADSKKEGSSGLDLKSEGFFFVNNKSIERSEGDVYEGMVFSIKDKSIWENFLKTNKIALKETTDLKFESVNNCKVYHSSLATTYAWNDEVVVLAPNVVDNAKMNSFFSSTEDKAIKLPQFKKFLDKSGHIGIYLSDLGSMSDNLGGAMAFLREKKSGGFSSYVNFENGKVKFDFEMLGDKESIKQFDFFNEKPVSNEMLALLPDAKPTGLVALNFDMTKVLSFISQNEGLNTGLRMFMASKGLTLNDLKEIFNGELVFTISFMNPTSDEFMARGTLEPQVHVMIGSNNPEKLKSVLDDMGMIKFGDNAWQTSEMGQSNINVVIRNKTIMVTNNDVNAKNFSEGFAGIALKNEVIKSGAKSSSNYIYFNINEYLVSNPMLGSGFITPEITEQMDYLEIKGNYTNMEGGIYLKDKAQNSLKTIMGLLNNFKLRPAYESNDIHDSVSKENPSAKNENDPVFEEESSVPPVTEKAETESEK